MLDYSEPTIFASPEQVLTYNTYEELFINRETLDTTRVNGTWIALWKRQNDQSWKLHMTTWHQN